MKRPTAAPEILALITAVLLTVYYNGPLWSAVLKTRPEAGLYNSLFLASWFVLLVAFLNFFLVTTAYRSTVRPAMIAIVLLASVIRYFMVNYGVSIDRNMVQNLFATDIREAGEYLTWHFLGSLTLFGFLPALALGSIAVRPRSLSRQLAANLIAMGASLSAIGLVALCFYPDFASQFRNHRELRLLVNPTSAVHGLTSYLEARYANKGPTELIPVGKDVRKSGQWLDHRRPALVLLVVGETARARNFSLDGYRRVTNPRLAGDDVLNFTDVSSCGTDTAVSLPCMFSPFTRSHYDKEEEMHTESLLDVLKRAGFDVIWRDNNSGCKGVCDRVEYQDVSSQALPGQCLANGECRDSVLLRGLKPLIASHTGNLVIVLHQKGSHGPAYFARVPPDFEQFTPPCHSSDLSRCSRAKIVNAYDNTILYTDWLLDKLVHLLQQGFPDRDSAMLYVSDHGESLGEHHLYLHGTPYFIAPAVQTHVPMIAWFSDNYRRDFDIDLACVHREEHRPLSHDNYFHSVLGMLRLRTTAYDRRLDIFGRCYAGTRSARGTAG